MCWSFSVNRVTNEIQLTASNIMIMFVCTIHMRDRLVPTHTHTYACSHIDVMIHKITYECNARRRCSNDHKTSNNPQQQQQAATPTTTSKQKRRQNTRNKRNRNASTKFQGRINIKDGLRSEWEACNIFGLFYASMWNMHL